MASLVARRHGLTILWLTAAAMRFSELATLKLSALDLNSNRVLIAGSKGSETNEVSICPALIECTIAWRSRGNVDSELLLPASTGKPINNDAFNRDVMKPMGRLFGVRLSAHSLRDTGAQKALEEAQSKGMGIQAVQGFMRHRSLNSTEHYLRKTRERSMRLQMHSGAAQEPVT